MASTSPFPDADGVRGDADDVDGPGAGRRARRGRRHGRRASERGARAREEAARASGAHLVSGFPAWQGMRPVLGFMALPALMAFAIAISGGWPRELLYSVGAVLGLYVALSTFRGVELVLACLLFYLPFSTTYAIRIAPGINGTNMLLLMGLFAAVLQAAGRREAWVGWPKGTFIVFSFGLLSAFSAFTVTLLPGGYSYLVYTELLNYKAWLDQFLFYFIVVSAVRDPESAKRVFVYLCIGSIVLVIYTIPEMLEKGGRSTIEKSRIGGPHQQSNQFGGFVAYTLMPLVALFVTYIRDIRAWLLTPYFLLAAKVLITTFSRGAYLAMAVGGLMAGYLRGRGFLAFWMTLALCFFLVFPSMLPEAVVVRLESITEEQASTSAPEELDKSSQHRLVLWRAAAKMIVEDPWLGKGFKGFPYLKAEYTEQDVHESDPHNMYLYVGSQMGLPALSLFILILIWAFVLGRRLSRDPEDRFVRAIGIGGAAATACYAAVCLFGSRATNLEFTAYFWAYLVVMQILYQDQLKRRGEVAPEARAKVGAFAAAAGDDEPTLGGGGRGAARRRAGAGWRDRARRLDGKRARRRREAFAGGAVGSRRGRLSSRGAAAADTVSAVPRGAARAAGSEDVEREAEAFAETPVQRLRRKRRFADAGRRRGRRSGKPGAD